MGTTLVGGANYNAPPSYSGAIPGKVVTSWTDPSVHNGIVGAALSGNQSALGALGTGIVALGGGMSDIARLLTAANTPRPMTTSQPTYPVATVTQPRPATTTAPVSYNQPYTDNSRSIAVSLPDMFSAQPMIPPSQMDFGSLAPLQPMNIPRPVTPQSSQPIPAAVSMGVGNLPMAATPPARVAQSPVTLQPQQARADQQLPEVSPTPQGQMPERQPEMPPVAPRYAPPPMAVPSPYAQAPMQPPVNPYARPMPPMPPQMTAQRFGDLADTALTPPRQFYQGPPAQKPGFLARLGRGMQAAAGGLNPSIGAVQAARAKAMADVQMKMLEVDAQGERNYADNRARLAERIMQEESQNNRTDYTQQNENYRQQLSVQAQGKLSQSQGMEMLSKGLAIVPTNQADMLQKQQMLAGASQALGQDFTGMLNQTSTEGSNAALKQAMEFKKEAMSMMKATNELQMMPIENDIKRLQQLNAATQAANAPLDAMAKRMSIANGQADLASKLDPQMQAAKRAEAIAKSQDVQRRGDQDAFAAIQKKAQMGATMIGQANQMLANPMAMFDQAAKARANQLIQQGQALQQEAYVSYQRPLLKPQTAGMPLQDMGVVEQYKLMTGGDVAKAKAMAKADGWVLPELSSPRVGMK